MYSMLERSSVCSTTKNVLLTKNTSPDVLFIRSNPGNKKVMWKNFSLDYFGILLPKLFWPTVRKNCSTDQEKLLKFEAGGREFAKFSRSLEQFIQTVKGQSNIC